MSTAPAALPFSVLSAAIKAWSSTGAAEVAGALRERAIPSSDTATPHPLKVLLHDLCRAVTRPSLYTAAVASGPWSEVSPSD